MTLNGVMAVILRYFSEFGYLPGVLRKSSRSLSRLLMSSCLDLSVSTHTRGHKYKLYKHHFSVNAHKYFFSNRICDIWNANLVLW